ncbi:hypothetical protein F2981_02960 [Sinorhizobium meliloti]|nr:hypothetical protein [Sinorhizobium meliloti]
MPSLPRSSPCPFLVVSNSPSEAPPRRFDGPCALAAVASLAPNGLVSRRGDRPSGRRRYPDTYRLACEEDRRPP